MGYKEDLNKLNTLEEKEAYVMHAIQGFVENNNYENILDLLGNLQTYWTDLSTARLTKILTKILDAIVLNENNFEQIIELLKNLIIQCKNKKLLECELKRRLVYLYLISNKYKECLDLIKEVVVVLKKFDDKINLIRIFLYESKVYYMLRNADLAKSALTAARAMAVNVACPMSLQAEIDVLNGMFLVDEGCYDSATGYFVEGIEGFLMDKQIENAKKPLSYLILSKILAGRYDEIKTLFNTKSIKKMEINEENDHFIKMLVEVKEIARNRDVIAYQKCLVANQQNLETDVFLSKHLTYYYNKLLENNILKNIEPYSHVKIAFIAEQLHFEKDLVEDKLRMMILDKKIHGILDHKTQCLVLFDKKNEEKTEFEKNIFILESYMNQIKNNKN